MRMTRPRTMPELSSYPMYERRYDSHFNLRDAFETGRTCIRNGLTRKLPNKYVNVTRLNHILAPFILTISIHVLRGTLSHILTIPMWDFVIYLIR